MAGTSGVTGTRIRSAFSKMAWLSVLYDGCRSTTTKSKPRRAAVMASATRVGSRMSVCSGDDGQRHDRACPDGWAEAISVSGLRSGRPRARRASESTTVRTASTPSDVVTWPVTVSASMSRTFWPLADLEGGGEVGRDGRLADAALRVEHGDDRRPAGPAVGGDVAALEDRPGAVVDGLAADAHRLDAPAQRLGRVGAGEVLVLDAAAARRRRSAGRACAARRP